MDGVRNGKNGTYISSQLCILLIASKHTWTEGVDIVLLKVVKYKS